MRYLVVFSIAVFATSYFSSLPPPNTLWLLLFLAVCSAYRRYFMVASLCCGLFVGCYQGHRLVDSQLSSLLEGVPITLEGTVSGLPTKNQRRQRFLFSVESVVAEHSAVRSSATSDALFTAKNEAIQNIIGKTLQLSLYAPYRRPNKKIHHSLHHHRHGQTPSVANIATGQRWRLTVKLRRPRGFVNPASMDYQAHLLRRHIVATGYVVNANTPDALLNKQLGENCLIVIVDCIRSYIKSRLSSLGVQAGTVNNTTAVVTEPAATGVIKSGVTANTEATENTENTETMGVINALALGDSQDINDSQWEVFSNTGTVHLLAISGLHIGLAAVIGFFIGRSLQRAMGVFWPFCMGLRVLPAIFSIVLSLSYSLLAGMSLPTQRALIMVSVYQFCTLIGLRISPWALLFIALSGVAIIDPLAVHSTGFWLSFVAVAVLLYGFVGYAPVTQPFIFRQGIQAVKAQWLLTLGLLLPGLYWLQGASVSAPLVNVFAIPWVSFVVVPLIFILLSLFTAQWLWSFFGEELILQAAVEWVFYAVDLSVKYLIDGLAMINQFSSAFWHPNIPQASLTSLFLGGLGIVYILSPRGLPYRYCGVFLLFPIVFADQKTPELAVTFLDVGQGTAVVVETKNHLLVYDTGRRFSDRFNTGEHIIAPYLRSLGRSVINKVVVSHADADHIGGLSGLLNTVALDGVVLSGEPDSTKVEIDVLIKPCFHGQQWRWDDVGFTVLWPSRRYVERAKAAGVSMKSNNLSCVLLISHQGRHVLLTGDIERSTEYALLGMPDLPKEIDIMLVPHHGSKTSSSDSLLSRLKPSFAVVTAGYNNQYGHPHPAIVSRYSEASTELMNTAQSGAVKFTLQDEDSAWIVEKWRQSKKRYWFDRGD